MSEEKTGTLATKLAEVMQEVGTVEERGQNTFQNYSYVTDEDLVNAVREKLAIRHVILLPAVKRVTYPRTVKTKSGDHQITRIDGEWVFIDGDSGERLTVPMVGEGQDGGDKGIYKAYTGALKYVIRQSFLIATGDDPERGQKGAAQKGAAQQGAEKADNGKPTQKAKPIKPTPVAEKRAEALYDLWKHSSVEPARLGLWLVQNGSEDVDAGSEDSLAKAISALPKDKADALEAKLREKATA